MSSEPWEADRPLSIEAAATVIKSCFPQVDTRHLKHLGSGWDFDAFLTNDDWVIRFPRRADCADQLAVESQVHEPVREALPDGIQVPRGELADTTSAGFPYPFTGHRYIRGDAADAVEPDHFQTLARELGEILGAIHAITVTSARTAGVMEMDAEEVGRKEWFDRVLNATEALSGIDPVIDIAVQSRDFVFPVTWKGWSFANEVLSHYPHAIDSEFGARLRFMSQLLSMAWLADEFKRGVEVEKHLAWVHNAFSPGIVRQVRR